jgi:hypothetical protein
MVLAALGTAASSAAISAAINDVNQELTEGRSVVLEIDNNTDLTLHKTADQHDHGGWAVPPKTDFPPHDAMVFGSQSTGVLTGTEGSVTFGGDGIILTASWDNPWIGGNSCDASLSGPNGGLYRVRHTTGSGNQQAHMLYELFPYPGWSPWYKIHPETVFDHTTQRITALSRTPDHVDLFTIGFDNAVWSTWWDNNVF